MAYSFENDNFPNTSSFQPVDEMFMPENVVNNDISNEIKEKKENLAYNFEDNIIPNTSNFPPVDEMFMPENVVNNDNTNEIKEKVENPATEIDSAANASTPSEKKRVKWIEEKTTFLSSVLANIDRNTIYQHVSSCSTEDDVQVLLLRLMEEDATNDSI